MSATIKSTAKIRGKIRGKTTGSGGGTTVSEINDETPYSTIIINDTN